MRGDTIKLLEFLEPSRTRFIIPLYQRNYDWKEEHCKQLFEDLVRIHRNNVETHFFGSIVSRQESLSSKNILIIDGQQRITTVSLLMAALINAHKHGDLKCVDEDKSEIMWEDYLFEKHFSDRKFKLQPIHRDQLALDAILADKELVKDSNLTRNYLLFYNWAVNSGLTLDDIYESLERLLIININLDLNDDPQLIFESINSTGLDLSEADKIRNFFLMSLNSEKQEEYYTKYWNRIEEYTAYAPTMFMRDYLTLKLKRISKLEYLYHDFKHYILDDNKDRCEVLKDMLPYAKAYSMVVNASTSDAKVNKKLRQLRTLDSSVDMPFYIAFLNYAEEQQLSSDYIYNVLDVVENYWARRIMCNLAANALTKVFSTLHSDIVRTIEKQKMIDETLDPDYLEVLKYILLKKQGTSEFPRNARVIENFKTRQVYHMPIEYRYFIFERMENKEGKEVMDIVKSMKDGDTTIEHIMPQTLTPQWITALGENAKDIHEKYLHTFANLTLTGYNSNYSNHNFADKKSGYTDKDGKHVYGFDESAYRLSSNLKTCTQWTEAEIIARGEALCKDFISLWPEISSSFEPKEMTDSISFDSDDLEEMTGRYPAAYSFKGDRHRISTFADMLVELCQLVHHEHSVVVEGLCHKNSFFYDNDQGHDYAQFADGCWVWKANSTRTKMNIIRHLFDACLIPYSDLEFELYPQAENSNTSAEDEMRIAFWDYFYEYQAEHAGLYKDCTTPHTAWYASRCESGGNITSLVFNVNVVRVELYWDRWDKAINKALFDKIFADKANIEKQIGATLDWQRLDDKRACRISITKPYSYKKASDYQLISEFFTDMSNKFWEAFISYFRKPTE